jgi:hypothetical protein
MLEHLKIEGENIAGGVKLECYLLILTTYCTYLGQFMPSNEELIVRKAAFLE